MNTELGRIYQEYENDQDLSKYVRSLENMVSKGNDFFALHVLLGNAYGRQGKNTDAVRELNRAIELNPGDASAHYQLGFAYGKLNRHQEAISAYQRAVEIDPIFSKAWANLGARLGRVGRLAEAINAFQTALRINPDDDVARKGMEEFDAVFVRKSVWARIVQWWRRWRAGE
jgi:superkiller protein 3